MSIYACIDDQTPANAEQAGSLRGWITADFKITSVVAELEAGRSQPLAYGHRRPDVAKVFPDSAMREKCGFFVGLDGIDLSTTGTLWICDENGKWHQAPVNWLSKSPQSWSTDSTAAVLEPPRHVTDAASVFDLLAIEENVHAWLEKSPRLRMRIDLINRCNLRCVMCHYNNPAYTSKPRKNVSIDDFKQYFEPIGKYVSEALLSCADEPLLAPSFTEVLYYLSENFPHVSISFCTNGMLFTPDIQKAVIETSVQKIMISLDGVTPETYESIRKGGKYDKVLNNVVNFAKLKRGAGVNWPELQLNFVLMRSNVHEAPALVEVAKSLDAASVEYHHAVPTNGIDMGEEKLENHPALFNAYREKIVRMGRENNIEVYLPDPFATTETLDALLQLGDLSYFQDFLDRHETKFQEISETRKPPAHHSLGIAECYPDVYCELPFSEIYVVDQTNVRPCPYQHRVSVDLNDYQDLMSAFRSEPFAELRRAMLTREGDPGCVGCPLKGGQLPFEPARNS